MSDRQVGSRMAQLQARAHMERLAAQLALLEVGEQLAPLRSAIVVIGAASRVLSPGGTAGPAIRTLIRFGGSHPLLVSSLAAAAVQAVRRRPLALLLAGLAGAAAWWLFRPLAGPRK